MVSSMCQINLLIHSHERSGVSSRTTLALLPCWRKYEDITVMTCKRLETICPGRRLKKLDKKCQPRHAGASHFVSLFVQIVLRPETIAYFHIKIEQGFFRTPDKERQLLKIFIAFGTILSCV